MEDEDEVLICDVCGSAEADLYYQSRDPNAPNEYLETLCEECFRIRYPDSQPVGERH